MRAKRKPFNDRAKMQLAHLNRLNRRYKSVQERWATFFKQMKTQIADLKKTETKIAPKGSSVELTVIKSQITELEGTLDQARDAYIKKK